MWGNRHSICTANLLEVWVRHGSVHWVTVVLQVTTSHHTSIIFYLPSAVGFIVRVMREAKRGMFRDITSQGKVEISNELSRAFWQPIWVCMRFPLAVPKQFQEKQKVTEITSILWYGETRLLSNSQVGVSERILSAFPTRELRFHNKPSIDAEQLSCCCEWFKRPPTFIYYHTNSEVN